MRITKTQKVECCAECFLYAPDHDMSATIPACRELCDRELHSYLKFKKKCNENNSIALNCPFLTAIPEKHTRYWFRRLIKSKKGDFVIEKEPKCEYEEPPPPIIFDALPSDCPCPLSYFYFLDTINHFSSLGLSLKNAKIIREGILNKNKIYVKRNGDMRIKEKIYPGAFKPFFEVASKRPDPIDVPKNEDAVEIRRLK